ncbi:MAG: c-type cytochrome [Planctomycetota bacterium]
MSHIAIRIALFLTLAATARAQTVSEEAVQFFKQNCTSCHTIGGGRLAGPDLKDAGKRQAREWHLRYLQNPKAMIDSGDAYAQKIFEEARGVYMPTVPGMTRDRAASLLDLIDAESLLEKSQFLGSQVSDRPLTAADVTAGEALFRGATRIASGAPPCISCHTVNGIGGFGGGSLGPDLTSVYARLEGRKSLAAWLSSPPALTMQPVFGKQPLSAEEVLALVAYLKSVAEQGVAQAQPAALQFMLAGLFGAAAILVLFDYLWRNRYRAVRQPLVEQASR